MSDARSYLFATLQDVVDGGDLTTEELDAAIPDPLVLDEIEKDAWEQLSHWADDDHIRAKDDNYAAFKRDWMRDHLTRLGS